MSTDLNEEANATVSRARTALVRTLPRNDPRLGGLLKSAFESARKTAVQARLTLAGAAGRMEHRYLHLRNRLRERPNAALVLGATAALGLGLLLWIDHRDKHESPTP